MLAPTPFFFGPDSARLFGWLHAAPVQGGALGLVVCNPFGFEEVCAHRSLAHLAHEAAAAGVPALRFDYAGCGNSSGDEFDPDTLARWVASVHHAVDTLKQRAGVRRVALVGLRLGSTLATLAALQRDDIEALVCIAPVVQGRLYVRELRVLAASGASAEPAATEPANLLEAGGFFLTEETTTALAAVDLRKLPQRPAPHIVIVERDDMPSSAQWAQALAELGASVRSEAWPGYARMMDNPQQTQVPLAMVAGIVSVVKACSMALPRDGQAQPPALEPAAPSPLSEDFVSDGFCETPVRIATGDSDLFGVLTTGTQAGARAGAGARLGVLLINSGSVHHIGPNRLWVRLARLWAQRGAVVLRLDLSGIGDSAPHPQAQANVVYSAEAEVDISVALKYMRDKLNVGECHLGGVCSGAYHAFKAAVAGQPLASAIMINPLTFFWTPGMPLDGIKDYELVTHSEKYRRQLFSLAPWRKLLSGRLDVGYITRFVVRRVSSALQSGVQKLARLVGAATAEDLAHELKQAAGHGVPQKFVFAVGDPGLELLRSQGGRALEKLQIEKSISIDCIANADHTFTRLDARERLVKVLNSLVWGEKKLS